MGGVQTKAGQLTRSRLVLEPLAAALLLGVAADQLFRLPYPWGYLAVLGSPWVVIAWLCARRHRHLGPALLAAAVVVVGGLIVFGLFKLLAYGSDSVRSYVGEVWFWLPAGVVTATVVAVAGTWTHSHQPWRRAVGWALPVSALLAEAVVVWFRLADRERIQIVALLVLAAAPLTAWALRRSQPWMLVGAIAIITGIAVALAKVLEFDVPGVL